jgi:ABC-2 type transport system permease protein
LNKILIILAREYRMRLSKPSFWVLTLLIPLLLAALYALPVWLSVRNAKPHTVLVVDETGLFEHALRSDEMLHFRTMPDLSYAQRQMESDPDATAILFIPLRESTIPTDAFLLHQSNTPPLALQGTVGNQLQVLLRDALLEDVYHLDPQVYHSIASNGIRLHTQDVATGRESFAQVKSVLAIVLAALITLMLIIFGVQVVRSIQEERTTRMAEVLATAATPVQIVAGKIAGVALVATTQMLLWTLLTAVAVGGIEKANPELFAQARQQQSSRTLATKGSDATVQYSAPVHLASDAMQGLTAINMPIVAAIFILFFLLGYLFYGALLAALAARIDSDADALQWVLLLLSPLLLFLVLCPLLLQTPSGTLSTILSLLPFTAPAAVVMRLPFGIAAWQIVVAALLLVLCFMAAATLAARSYRHRLTTLD